MQEIQVSPLSSLGRWMGLVGTGVLAGSPGGGVGALGSLILLCSQHSVSEFVSLLGTAFMLNYMQEYLGVVVSKFVYLGFLSISVF